MINVGVSNEVNSEEAGRGAAGMALEGMNGTEAGWALAFCGGHHDPEAFLRGLRSELGNLEVVGGSAIGAITNQLLGYTGFECAVAVISSSLGKPVIVAVDGLEKDDLGAGRELGRRLGESVNGNSTALVFYDSIRSSPPPVLHVGSSIVYGIYAGLDGKSGNVNLLGAGTIGDFQMSRSYVFDGKKPAKHSAVAVVLPPSLRCHTTIMHGCIPVSSFLEITRIEGPVLYELDGKPALEVISDVLGITLSANQPSLTVTLGQKHGDPFAFYDESNYINRLIISANPEDGSVRLFEADFQAGAKVQIMSRDNQKMLASVEKRSRDLLSSLGSGKPLLAFYIDCAGRSSAFSGSDAEEAGLVQSAVGGGIPLLGFYSGVEIASLLGRSRPLEWTGVLSLFTAEQ